VKETNFKSRKFITTWGAIILIFVIVMAAPKVGSTENIMLMAIATIGALAGAYNRENNITKKIISKVMGEAGPDKDGPQ
jgi:general stress protein CsbA